MGQRNTYFRYCVRGVCLLTAFAMAAAAYAQQGWKQAAPFPAPSEELQGATANGKLYVFAGLTELPQWRPKGYVYEYDPATNQWTKKKPMALPAHHVVFVGYKGKIYAFGGFVAPKTGPSGWKPINNSWEYDPATDTWKALAPMPSKRGGGAAAVVDGKIYVIGGVELAPGSKEGVIHLGLDAWPSHAVGTNEEYDIATNTWRERSPMPTARNHLAVAAVNGKIYAIGGRLGSAFSLTASPTDIVEEYDPATNIWGNVMARMPTPTSGLTWGVYKGCIYVAGGEAQNWQMTAAFRAVEAFDPALNEWFVLPSLARARAGMAGGVIGDTLHLVSGDLQSAGTGIRQSTAEHDVLNLSRVQYCR
ncbi:MAG TPA: kelch repeat-containing protein [Patescibacteria group bacterium]|nr:kelch repeat-containing protein [Patescibacteria group bacterium]